MVLYWLESAEEAVLNVLVQYSLWYDQASISKHLEIVTSNSVSTLNDPAIPLQLLAEFVNDPHLDSSHSPGPVSSVAVPIAFAIPATWTEIVGPSSQSPKPMPTLPGLWLNPCLCLSDFRPPLLARSSLPPATQFTNAKGPRC